MEYFIKYDKRRRAKFFPDNTAIGVCCTVRQPFNAFQWPRNPDDRPTKLICRTCFGIALRSTTPRPRKKKRRRVRH